jgi:hypothetical protein
MQVNSAQDWLTKYKRRVISRSYNPPQELRSSSLYTSVLANQATQRERFVAPFQGARGGASGGATYSSDCCTVSSAFAGTALHSVVRFNVIPALSYRATTVRS